MIHGYADKFSVAPNEKIEFKLSCESDTEFNAEIVRLTNGDANPCGPGRQIERIKSSVTGRYPGKFKSIITGSWVECGMAPLSMNNEGGIHAFVFATAPKLGNQAILSTFDIEAASGWWLGIEFGRLSLCSGDGETVTKVISSTPMMEAVWYSVTATWSNGYAKIDAIPIINSYNSIVSPIVPVPRVKAEGPVVTPSGERRILIAASAAKEATVNHFNGKIEAPKVYDAPIGNGDFELLAIGGNAAASLVAHWDFSVDITNENVATDRATDIGPNELHGRCRNSPSRGVTGRNWRGRNEVYWQAPNEYGAIKFNSDDLEDAEWETDIVFLIPPDLGSGVYALHAHFASFETYIPFWVLPERGTATAKILLLFPTATYMAYANQDDITASGGQAVAGHTPVVDLAFCDLMEHPEFGRSMYDPHPDGTGISFSSRLRPITTIRPDVRHGTGEVWCLAADLQIVSWLERKGMIYDVATDEELHHEGSDLLDRYNVVITGTHPEYYSENMLDGWETYLSRGGRAMYLGGNGFYWVIGYHPEKRHLIELRRGENGARAWQSQAGELYLQTTGERSGLWRNRNRAPNKLFGVGTAAIGFDHSGAYVPMNDWMNEEVSFITTGCEDVDVIGDFGLVGEGAAGSEVDRYDLSLGTPPHALLLASSAGSHSANYLIVPEDVSFVVDGLGGDMDARVRADLVYFTTQDGGAVFSASSISWCSSLSHNNYHNSVETITSNVLRRFELNSRH